MPRYVKPWVEALRALGFESPGAGRDVPHPTLTAEEAAAGLRARGLFLQHIHVDGPGAPLFRQQQAAALDAAKEAESAYFEGRDCCEDCMEPLEDCTCEGRCPECDDLCDSSRDDGTNSLNSNSQSEEEAYEDDAAATAADDANAEGDDDADAAPEPEEVDVAAEGAAKGAAKGEEERRAAKRLRTEVPTTAADFRTEIRTVSYRAAPRPATPLATPLANSKISVSSDSAPPDTAPPDTALPDTAPPVIVSPSQVAQELP